MSNTVSQASLLALKAVTAEHEERFEKEGRAAKRGAVRIKAVDKIKDPFLRPSPGLVKRLAREARNEANRRHFDDEGPSDEQRRAILEAKARKYDALKRGDLSGFTERELAEANIDFTRNDEWSDHSSDVDESAMEPRRWGQDEVDTFDDMEQVEYVDELGRTRFGTRREAKEAERERQRSSRGQASQQEDRGEGASYTEVQQSTIIHGDQNYFPVYEPDPEALKKKYMEAEAAARAHHYDSTKEVRVRGAGAYQFSLDEEKRAEQMASLDAERLVTERAQREATKRGGLSAARQAYSDRIEARRTLVEAKRAKLLGGPKKLEELRQQRREEEATKLLDDFEMRVDRCDFSGYKVYPSRGKVYVRGDSKTFRFAGSKSESLFLQRKNPRKIAWTQVYRRMHKKGITEEVAKKRSRKNVKIQRGVVGADLASILAKRTAKPEVRAAARQAAITKAKAAKKEKETKKASRPQGSAQPKVSKQAAKGAKGGR
ncbi:hypothetical protein CC85DRAFT_306233 [Cutaneotrichosporon oleaginosum]|uniref:Large ribosomal subunit protein eL24-related N-terminal domain-containing protein n=1 Tax=Cutaneotrichosporon oleaginosum TaxID=879819 RepID=A0A0J1BEK5_9TREE|nr:uncharacterized protein CC85DRAFT_306233 [Cutaneotrichosporon oleaginosum]KLT46559.1 hypothetical protein CC85DRAFT_306233 [Cutaneotrichosporon oleaginosum]